MDTTVNEDETPASISDERFNLFKKSLTQLFRESRAQSLPSSRFRDYLAEKHSAQPFQSHETRAAFERMTDANQIMVADDIIFLI
jgi:DNA replication licensing factor MCM3